MKHLLVTCLCVSALARAETRPRYAGTVEATLLGAPATLDPVLARTHAEATVVGLVFDTLYKIGPDGVAQPHVAIALPSFDEKHTTARIQIAKGIHFQDGSELTARDVVASLERARVRAKWILAPIVDMKADGDTIELALRAPISDLPTLLALPQTAITKGGKPPGDKPIGSGPYAVTSWDRGKHVMKLAAFEDHFAGRPYVDLVLRWYDTPDGEARRFEIGDAQVSARGVSAFTGGRPTYKADDVEGPAALLVFVGFGQAHPQITSDRAFRHALDLALGRGGFDTIGTGERIVPTRLPVPVEAGGAPVEAAARAGDLAAAKTALADAATRVPALAQDRLPQLRLELLVEDTRPDDRELGEKVVHTLDRLGIAAQLTALPAAQLRERVAKGQADLWIGQVLAPVTAPELWWGAAFAAGNDDWPVASLATGVLDPSAAAKAFAEREPIVPLMFRAVRLWHRTDVRGLAFDASGRPCYADMFLFGSPVRAR